MTCQRRPVSRPVQALGIAVCLLLAAGCNRDGLSTPTAPSTTPPTATAVTPASGTQGTTLTIMLTGTDFVVGETTAVTMSTDGVTVSDVAVQSATTVTATLTIADDAPLGSHTIALTRASSGTGAAVTFTVLPPPPTLASLDPATVVAGTTITVTLTGTNFVPGATSVAVGGTGITVTEVTVGDGTSLTATLVVDRAADLGPHDVTVTTAGGTTAAQTLTVNPAVPALLAIDPSSGLVGTTVGVTLSGTSFVPGATSVAISGSGVTVTDVTVGSALILVEGARVSRTAVAGISTSLTARFVIDRAASLGARTVTVATTGGTSNGVQFTVLAPAPEIGSFAASPATITEGHSSTLSWSGIINATGCSVDHGVGGIPCSDGSMTVSPTATTTYTLTSTGDGGTATRTTTVTVNVAPAPAPAPTGSQTFNFTGGVQNFVVPAGVTQITIEAWGAQGGAGVDGGAVGTPGAGASGGKVSATLVVTPGESLATFVGGAGAAASAGGAGGAGGFNGGASGGDSFGLPRGAGGGGGGASDVRRGGNALTDRVVVAGGGGGGGGTSGANTAGAGGAGGGTTGAAGANGQHSLGGGGGTQAAGGAGSGGVPNGAPGTVGSGGAGAAGGDAASSGGAGGGGGYYGGGGTGGGASTGGGGGGSSFTTPGATNVTHQQGVRTGNGLLVISW